MDWCLEKTSLAACQIGLPLLISWRPFSDCSRLAGTNITFWRQKWRHFFELSMKKSHLSRTNDCLSRTSESSHAKPAAILISCRQPMTHRLRNHSMLRQSKGTNYKVHTLFIAACLSLVHKLQSPCNTCIARGQWLRGPAESLSIAGKPMTHQFRNQCKRQNTKSTYSLSLDAS
jgi:hypothetical protein